MKHWMSDAPSNQPTDWECDVKKRERNKTSWTFSFIAIHIGFDMESMHTNELGRNAQAKNMLVFCFHQPNDNRQVYIAHNEIF